MSSSPPPQWSRLLPELMLSVAERLHIGDIARLRSVCRHWAWTLGRPLRGYPPPPKNLVHLDNSVPWMLLPSKHREEADYLSFQLADRLAKGTISPLPEMVGRRCIGTSPDGSWLVTLDLSLEPRILNPLTRKEFLLPSLLTIPNTDFKAIFDGSDGSILEFFDYKYSNSYPLNLYRDGFIRRIIITGAPPNVVAVALYGFDIDCTCMALARPGEACWAPIPKARWFRTFVDAVYHQEDQSLYAVTCDGSVIVFNLSNFINSSSLSPPAPKIFTTALTADHDNMSNVTRYIVFLDDQLLQVWRSWRYHTAKGYDLKQTYDSWEDMLQQDDEIAGIETHQIEVMRLEPREQQTSSRWVNVDDLGNYSLFIGCNHTLAVFVSMNSGLRPNSVYFTDDSHGQCDIVGLRNKCDVGVYDINNGTIERYLPPDSDQEVIWPPPSWFRPPQLHVSLPN